MKKITLVASLILGLIVLHSCINRPGGGTNSNALLTYSASSIEEEVGNLGAFNKEIVVTLRGSEFVDSLNEGTEYGTTDFPEGLVLTVTRDSATQATISITGNADVHNGCGKNKMSFYFLADAFIDAKLPIAFETSFDVTYIKPELTFSAATLEEDPSNDGSFPTVITVTASNDGNFSQSSGDLVLDEDYELFGIPEGLTTTVTAVDSQTVTITFSGTADDNSPVYDAEAGIKFKSNALSEDFCEVIDKQDIYFKMYRSVLMFSTSATTGEIGSGGRAGADDLCEESIPNLPEDYTGVRAFISVSAADDIEALDNNYDVPTGVLIESESGEVIANNWADLVDGNIDQSLTDAGVLAAATLYWTGSNSTGAAVAERCTTGWDDSGAGVDGQVGNSDEVNGDWLTNGDTVQTCDSELPILCIAFVD